LRGFQTLDICAIQTVVGADSRVVEIAELGRNPLDVSIAAIREVVPHVAVPRWAFAD
jgi:hypothetical protein